jgi:hypothetical protein
MFKKAVEDAATPLTYGSCILVVTAGWKTGAVMEKTSKGEPTRPRLFETLAGLRNDRHSGEHVHDEAGENDARCDDGSLAGELFEIGHEARSAR